MTIRIGDEFYRKDPVFDGTKKSALKLIKKVFPKLSKYSIKEFAEKNNITKLEIGWWLTVWAC